ncbi:MAG: carbohydrate-binding domain-containing protein [Bacteroidales bacterium]|nr:carbohydrate-binding domain-containing protein [Bacteroidales bacterium]
MKKIFTLLTALVLTVAAGAQTLNVTVGSVTYQFPAAQTGEMTYASGTTLTIMGKAFTISDIDAMSVDGTEVTDNTVSVAYSGTSASVTVSGNIAQYLTIAQSGAHVSITQSDDVAEEITYTLSGTSTDGEFYMDGSYKATVELNALTLTNATPVYSGAAVHVQNGKRIKVKVIDGTTSTLVDAASGSQKGCLYVKGHAEFAQSGTLNVTGNVKHGIKAGEYISIKNATINVKSAVGDGLNCTQYFLMTSGALTVSGTSDDGIQCDLEGDTNTGETTDHDSEDSGNVYITGGTITVKCTATAAKGIKCEGDYIQSDGTVSVTTTGAGEWDEDDSETKAAAGVSSDADITISGGSLTCTASGSGGKGMKCDDTFTVTGGTVTAKTTGGLYYNNGSTENTNYTGDTDNIDSDYYSSPKGIKAGLKTESGSSYTYSGAVVISGGTVNVSTSGYNAEGLESKNTLTISGGTVTINSYDDGINSAKEMYLKGGTITVVAANNDGIDSNANMYISGGTVIACGASGAECGFDAAEGYSFYITGGNVLGIGGSNNAVSSTTGSQCVLSTSGSVSASQTIKVTNGSTTLASFTVPSSYSSSGSGSGGFGGGNSGSSNILISCSGLTSNTSYTVTVGSSSSSVTASTTSSDSMGGGDQGGGGQGGGDQGGGGQGGGPGGR